MSARRISRTYVLPLCCALGLLVFVRPTQADATYSYTGNAFTNCSVTQNAYVNGTPTYYSDSACPAGPGISGTMTLSQPLPTNAVDYVPDDVVSVSFNAASYYVNFPDTTPYQYDAPSQPGFLGYGWQFWTDSSGNITGWDLVVWPGGSEEYVSNTDPTNGVTGDSFGSGDCAVWMNNCFQFSNSNPGEWTMTPEPPTGILFPLGLAVLLIVGTGKRGLFPTVKPLA